MNFKIKKQDRSSLARVGQVETLHGIINTPAFVPVATQASVKSLSPEDLKNIGTEVILCNTYHLYLRPGVNLIKKFGGLRKFMNWQGPIITDSGGFQVFSLGFALEHGVSKIANIFPDEIITAKPISKFKNKSMVKIDNDGVVFYSHIDGAKHRFTPELSIKIQEKLGADIIFAFDECTSPLNDYTYTKKAMERTHRWAVRCLDEFVKCQRLNVNCRRQALFGIVQGGEWQDLRIKSAKFISKFDFDGFGIGGSLGKSKKQMYKILDWVCPILPDKKPRHLLGIGEVEDIFEAVKRGIDLFDCVMPTREARNGTLITKKGKINILNAIHSQDKNPIEKDCGCYTCQNFSKAYLRHLFKAKELLVYRLATIHNLYFMEDLMRNIRKAILENKFLKFKKEFLAQYKV